MSIARDVRVRVRAAHGVAPEHPGRVAGRSSTRTRPSPSATPSGRGTRLADRPSSSSRRRASCVMRSPPRAGRRRGSCAYPVQRQRLPESASRISSSLGSGVALEQVGGRHDEPRRAEAALHRAGLDERLLHAVQPPRRASPSTVTTSCPSACAASTRHAHTSVPSSSTEHEPHSPCSHAFFEPGSPSRSRSDVEQALACPDVRLVLLAVDPQRILMRGTAPARAASGRASAWRR